MRLSPTLSFYIGRQFLACFLVVFMVFVLLILVVDIIELLRRSASRPEITFSMVLEMALLKLPHMGQQTFPFAALFGGMAAFWRLTRNYELMVTRAAGVSAWQFLLPVIAIAFLLGIFKITMFNPLASATLFRFERIEAVQLRGRTSYFALSSDGLWLRQANKTGQSVVHADSVLLQGSNVELRDVIVFMYKGADKFFERVDAEFARLEDGFWHLSNARVHQREKPSKSEKDFWLETDFTLGSIQDSFAPPETMSFWALPDFIETLENAGFSAVRHRIHWNSLLAEPFLLCAMILISAIFTLRLSRRGGTAFIIGGGVLTGFVLYFFTDVILALGSRTAYPWPWLLGLQPG